MQTKANKFWMFYSDKIYMAINKKLVIGLSIDMSDQSLYVLHVQNLGPVKVFVSKTNPSFDEVLQWINYKESSKND